ncbi:hypothetical protein [Ottowia sp. VDI28]|uniref:hypothetical protein n=1 Tax=Ottowia sp. VDI28 TaxID=3133968 RepID=UPI003C304756
MRVAAQQIAQHVFIVDRGIELHIQGARQHDLAHTASGIQRQRLAHHVAIDLRSGHRPAVDHGRLAPRRLDAAAAAMGSWHGFHLRGNGETRLQG